jgi:hypothetical protein
MIYYTYWYVDSSRGQYRSGNSPHRKKKKQTAAEKAVPVLLAA